MTRRLILVLLALIAGLATTLQAARLTIFIDGDNRTPYDASRGKAGRAEWTAAVNARKGTILTDDFQGATPDSRWHKVVPTFVVENGVLKGTQTRDQNIPAANGKPEVKAHAAVHGLELPTKDSVVEAKIRHLKASGRNAFAEYQLPAAVMLLKQGAGRLIRDEHDRGVLMILDERLVTRSYGRTVVASLPAFARTRDEAEAIAFLSARREAMA